ncbi:MAG: AAA family ATPase [Deltaproteobacteria bacterium]|jgi:SpoVK/Ycf46/Vps4 family AAA+-type ATPase|nr:AAA family ATPase [Deltaproteobacteria bacterium]
MNNNIKIAPENIEPLLDEIREQIKQSAFLPFLRNHDDSPYGLGINSNKILEILEKVIGVYQITKSLLTEKYKDNQVEVKIVNLVCVHLVSNLAFTLLNEFTDYKVRTINHFHLNEIKELVLNEKFNSQKLLADLASYVKKKSEPDLEGISMTACAYFKLMRCSLEKIALDLRFATQLNLLKETELKIFNYQTKLMGKLDKTPSKQHLLPITTEQIIGNSEFVNAGIKLVDNLLAYDQTFGKNPKNFNQILFGLGRPGCGKTATANALGNYLFARAESIDLPAKFKVIRRTDWASSYQNASAQSLIEIFTSTLENFAGVVFFYWPDIDTAFSSRTDNNSGNEEKDILGAAFGLFDGTILPFNGQWILVCDANYMQMDEATVSRLSQNPQRVNGPETDEDFAELLHRVLLGKEYEPYLNLDRKKWLKIGNFCRDLEISGRDLANISRKIIAKIEDFPLKEIFFSLDYQQREEYIKEHRHQIEFEFIRSQIEQTSQFKKAAEKMEKKDSVQMMVNRMKLEYEARQKVLEDKNKI